MERTKRERSGYKATGSGGGSSTGLSPASGHGPPLPVAGSGPPSMRLVAVPDSETKVDYSEIQILMRAVGTAKYGHEYKGKFYGRNEFYRISVERNHSGEWEFVAKRRLEPQMSSLQDCSMHRVGSRLYNITRLFWIRDVTKVPKSLQINLYEKLSCNSGLSWIDLNGPNRWNLGTPLECHEFHVESVVFGDNIYSLDSDDIKEPRCYLTHQDKWIKCTREPPQELWGCTVNNKMITQLSRQRILVHLTVNGSSKSYLYAWTPLPRNYWELITEDIKAYTWKSQHPNVIDDIIYFYSPSVPPYFSAYDLSNKKWVKVTWSEGFPLGAAGFEATSMFYVGNRIFCLAKSSQIDIDDTLDGRCSEWGSRVTFSLFRFYRTSTQVDGPLVVFTHLLTNSLACEGIWDVDDFISLSGTE